MLNHQLLLGDCLNRLKELPDRSIDAVVTDPPYGLSFMGKKWDYDLPDTATWAECLRVLKPGGNLLSFAGTRTQHRMVANILGAGFELQDIVLWTYGCLSEDSEVLTKDGWFNWRDNPGGKEIFIYDIVTGEYRWELPEKWYSYNVYNDVAYSIKSEATDQIVSKGHRCLISQGRGLEFKVAEELPSIANVPVLTDVDGGSYTISEATVTTIEYSGFFWCPTVSTGAFVARRNGKVFVTGNSGFPKSLDVSKAIDKRGGNPHLAARIGAAIKAARLSRQMGVSECDQLFCGGTTNWSWFEGRPVGQRVPTPETFARIAEAWPELLPLADAVAEVERDVIGQKRAGIRNPGDADRYTVGGSQPVDVDVTAPATPEAQQWAGWGTALKPAYEPVSIFTKGSSLTLHAEPKRLYYCAKAPKKERNLGLPPDATNTHPTIKPLKLMEQLCQLATPQGGTILDPFMGSGTTGIAALNMGYSFVGIDMGEEYFDIASRRLNSLFPKSEA